LTKSGLHTTLNAIRAKSKENTSNNSNIDDNNNKDDNSNKVNATQIEIENTIRVYTQLRSKNHPEFTGFTSSFNCV